MQKKTLPSLRLVTYQASLHLLHFGSYQARVADTQDSTLVVL